MGIWDGTVGSGTLLADIQPNITSGQAVPGYVSAVITVAAGAKTYNIGVNPNSATVTTIEAAATRPAYILVEAI
jgi:hypothetical protein